MADKYCAMIDFKCIEEGCEDLVKFNLMGLHADNGKTSCDHCHRHYQFNEEFIGKLDKLKQLIIAIKESEDILGDCNVAVMTEAGEVKIPYRLLLTRMNSMVTLNIGDQKVDFSFRIEPMDGSFR